MPAAVGPDWAPYRNGRWVWEDGYGWTWVADEPWGWAPYHYGSWYDSPRYGWCWYPPRPNFYVPWRPALVAFIGLGVGSGIALNFGGYDRIGWVPLAPFEPYHPWWGDRYGNRTTINTTTIVNTTNITNVTNNVAVYRNARYANAVTSVSSQRFAQGDFAHPTAVSAPQLREARVFHGALPVVPTASNLRFARSTAAPAIAVRPAVMEHSFAGNHSVVQRTPFTAQRATLAAASHPASTPQTAQPAGAASSAWSRFSPTRTSGSATPYVTHHATPSGTLYTAPGETQHTPRGEMHHALPAEKHRAVSETHRAPSAATHHSPPSPASRAPKRSHGR